MQISFCLRKLKSTSYKDADLFFYIEKNSDLHLIKM